MDTAALFTRKSVELLRDDYLPKIDRCLSEMSDADIWWRPNEASNSAGNLVLHLCGNVTQWIIGGVGGRPYHRHRQQEFDARGPAPAAELRAQLARVSAEALDIIRDQNERTLCETRQIQGYDVTVLEAIYHVIEHFSMHTGQIISMTKMREGRDLQLWQPPATKG
jgi:uncharacterized damage-inducible protein DinB